MKNIKVIAVIVAIAVVGLIIGMSSKHGQVAGAGSPTGTTNSTAKVASIIFAPSTGTSTFLYNSDGTDRAVTDEFSFCSNVGTSYTAYTGAGLASLTLQFATSSSNSTAAANANTNYVFNGAISTSTAVNGFSYVSSSTLPVLGAQGMVWPSGTYMRIFTNATNTASCVSGVHYLSM